MTPDAGHPDCLLNLAFPAELEEEVIELLREQPELVGGFTILPAEGFGAGAQLHTAMERVRGRARRRLLQVLLPREHLEPLLAVMRERLPSSEVAWWTIAISGFGRFA
jgi:hypothetical protein